MLFVNRVKLQQMSIENQLLVVHAPILIPFNVTPTKSIWSAHYLIDVFGWNLTGQCTILN